MTDGWSGLFVVHDSSRDNPAEARQGSSTLSDNGRKLGKGAL